MKTIIFAVLCLSLATFMNIDFEINPTIISKITTVLQVLTVCLALVRVDRSGIAELQLIFFWLTVVFTTISGLHYIFIGMGILQRGSSEDSNLDAGRE